MPEPKKTYRVLRILEYEGDEGFIKFHLENRGVKGTREFKGGTGKGLIREAVLGDTAEIIRIAVAAQENNNGR